MCAAMSSEGPYQWLEGALDSEVGDWRLEKRIRKSMMDVQSECEVIPRDFLCCKICDEEFKHPKYLVCLHSFCSHCLEGYVREEDDHRVYWCPVCGTDTEVSDANQGIHDLPDNLLARRLASPTITNQDKDKICNFCKNGGNFIDASMFCINCDDYLCTSCMETHHEQEDTKEHQIETVEENEMRSEYEDKCKLGHVIPRCCEFYDPLDIGAQFCVDCDIAVCADCHLSYHEEHRCAEMTAVADNFETKIKAPLLELQNDAEALQEAMVNLKKAERDTINQQKEMQNKVAKRKKYLFSMINEYEHVLLQEIDRRHTQHLDEIQHRRKELQMHLAAIDGVNDFTEKLVSYGSFEEKVLMRKKVGKRVRELCEEPLLTDPLEPVNVKLNEPNVAVESICSMFGELTNGNKTKSTNSYPSVDSGNASDSLENNDAESGLEYDHDNLASSGGSDVKMLSVGNSTEFRVKFNEQVNAAEYEAQNCFTLDNPKREIVLPNSIQHECLKGIGINKTGDIIVGASSANYQMVYMLEKRGIIRGQIPIQSGWNIHSVASDGKVALTIARGDNRYKVRILNNDCSGKMLTDTQIENFSLNFVTADYHGNLIVASNRYAHVTNFGKMTSKAGGNISMYGTDGLLTRRITNEDYQDLGMYILEKPHFIAVDNKVGNFYVADTGSHNVTGYDNTGELIFEYGNTDHEGEIYDGPDLVCADKQGNILVADKRDGRVDVLSMKGELKKSLFTEDIIKYMSVTPDKQLMLATAEGNIKFYEY